MIYYTYLSAIGEWTKPPKGTTEKELVACYREVRKLSTASHVPLAWWRDGVVLSPDVSRKVADLRRLGFTVAKAIRRR
jgi:hypothetical protein